MCNIKEKLIDKMDSISLNKCDKIINDIFNSCKDNEIKYIIYSLQDHIQYFC